MSSHVLAYAQQRCVGSRKGPVYSFQNLNVNHIPVKLSMSCVNDEGR